MPGRAVHFALEDEEVGRLLASPSDEERLEVLTEELEETLFVTSPERVSESDKAWFSIHLAFTAASALDERYADGELAIMGGEDLYHRDDYVMVLKTPEEARRVGRFLRTLTEAEFRTLYDGIPPDEYQRPRSNDDFRYTWGYLRELAEFFERSGAAELSVLFTVDP